MPMVDRTGKFRTEPGATVSLEEKPSGAIAAVLLFPLIEMWEGGEWINWNYGQEVYCRVWVIKKDKTVNQNGVNTLKNILGWDGDMMSLGTGWDVPACQVEVVEEAYEGKQSLKGSWINAYDDDPDRGLKPASPELLKKISNMYGSKIRAAFGARPVPSAPPAAPVSGSDMLPPDPDVPF